MTHKDRNLTDAVPTETPATDLTGPTAPTGDAGTSSPSTTDDTTSSAVTGKGAVAGADADTGHSVRGTVAGTTWVGLIVGAVILVLLLVFILQNGESVQLHMFVWQWNFPIGVGMLIAAVAGALIAACIGTVRIFQLRRQVRKGD